MSTTNAEPTHYTIKALSQALNLILKIDLSVQDKLTFAAKKWRKNYDEVCQKEIDKCNDAIEEFRVLNASVDDRNNLIVNEKGQYSYTPEKTAALTKKVKNEQEKLDAILVEFVPYTINKNNPAFDRAFKPRKATPEAPEITLFGEFEIEELKNIFIVEEPMEETTKPKK